MSKALLRELSLALESLKESGYYKGERVIRSPQGREITLQDGRCVLNFCANNYLGLAADPRVITAAQEALTNYGYGCASVRFICGTQGIHKALECALADFLSCDDCILYSSCFDANGGLFESLLGEGDAIFSDALNHASLIDGIRLCKAKRYRYANNDMAELERQLQEAQTLGLKHKLIVTDGVFSMDGIIANLPALVALAERYDALVMVDDSHAVGFMGQTGAGTPEFYGLSEKIDIYSGTLGKALGGASGGYIAGRQPIIDMLRQRSRPYLFSNTLAPSIAAASLQVLEIIKSEGQQLRTQMTKLSQDFRKGMTEAGFELVPGQHPIIAVMIGDAAKSVALAEGLLEEGLYVIAFSYPVVPKNKARIRTQISAAHRPEDVHFAIKAFTRVAKKLGILP